MDEQTIAQTEAGASDEDLPEVDEETFAVSQKLFFWYIGVTAFGALAFIGLAVRFFAQHDDPLIGSLSVAFGGAFLSLALTFCFKIPGALQRKNSAEQFKKLYRALTKKIDNVQSCTCAEELSYMQGKLAGVERTLGQLSDDVQAVPVKLGALKTPQKRWWRC